MFGSMINKGLTALIEKKLAGAGTVEHVELDKQQRRVRAIADQSGRVSTGRAGWPDEDCV